MRLTITLAQLRQKTLGVGKYDYMLEDEDGPVAVYLAPWNRDPSKGGKEMPSWGDCGCLLGTVYKVFFAPAYIDNWKWNGSLFGLFKGREYRGFNANHSHSKSKCSILSTRSRPSMPESRQEVPMPTAMSASYRQEWTTLTGSPLSCSSRAAKGSTWSVPCGSDLSNNTQSRSLSKACDGPPSTWLSDQDSTEMEETSNEETQDPTIRGKRSQEWKLTIWTNILPRHMFKQLMTAKVSRRMIHIVAMSQLELSKVGKEHFHAYEQDQVNIIHNT